MVDPALLFVVAEHDLLVALKFKGRIFSTRKHFLKIQDAELLLALNKIFQPTKNIKPKTILLSLGPQSFSTTRGVITTANALAFAYDAQIVRLPAMNFPPGNLEEIFALGNKILTHQKPKIFLRPTYKNPPNITVPKIKISKFHISAGGLVFNPKNKKALFIRRRDTGRIGLPKGHVEKGESLVSAATREIIEETGYEHFQYLGKLNVVKYRFHQAGKLHEKTEHQFLFSLRSVRVRKRLATKEIANLQNLWLTLPAALADQHVYPNLKISLVLAIKILKHRGYILN
ncbi:NUDIX domain-containing protein [Candidatus Parcubacteria bacterium]|jgi:8-oxo-dGTP pyrophosphatase MutT (NUDIX family)|nr:MAG: NUDIX domain-containing protein [Candidatus Parcubacteria bacterium]